MSHLEIIGCNLDTRKVIRVIGLGGNRRVLFHVLVINPLSIIADPRFTFRAYAECEP